MEEKYTKDYLVKEFTNQIEATKANISKLGEELSKQRQTLIKLTGALEGVSMIQDDVEEEVVDENSEETD